MIHWICTIENNKKKKKLKLIPKLLIYFDTTWNLKATWKSAKKLQCQIFLKAIEAVARFSPVQSCSNVIKTIGCWQFSSTLTRWRHCLDAAFSTRLHHKMLFSVLQLCCVKENRQIFDVSVRWNLNGCSMWFLWATSTSIAAQKLINKHTLAIPIVRPKHKQYDKLQVFQLSSSLLHHIRIVYQFFLSWYLFCG